MTPLLRKRRLRSWAVTGPSGERNWRGIPVPCAAARCIMHPVPVFMGGGGNLVKDSGDRTGPRSGCLENYFAIRIDLHRRRRLEPAGRTADAFSTTDIESITVPRALHDSALNTAVSKWPHLMRTLRRKSNQLPIEIHDFEPHPGEIGFQRQPREQVRDLADNLGRRFSRRLSRADAI